MRIPSVLPTVSCPLDQEISPGETLGETCEPTCDKPLFAHIVEELTEFVKDAEVIIHQDPVQVEPTTQ